MESRTTTANANDPVGRRLDGFDGLRGVAVLAVVLFHGGVLSFGWAGVDLFFCVSGFLITRILLDAKATGASTGAIMIPFYARRALRILPVAMLVALVVALVTKAGWSTLWYVTYLANWLPSPPAPRELGHYWTLAVEEQFYLLWPIVILTLTPSNSLKVAAGLLVLSPVVRAVLISFPFPFATTRFLEHATIARADSILAGCVLALLTRGDPSITPQRYRQAALLTSLTGLVAAYGLEQLKDFPWHPWAPKVAYVFVQPCLALAFGSALLFTLLRSPSWLRWRWLEWVGRVSYGVYVIHVCFSAWLLANVADPLLRTAILATLSLALAALSWRFVESPLLSLKGRWPMPRSPTSPVERLVPIPAE